MHCPTCKTGNLEPREIEQGLIGAGCKQCKGVLLSLIQYRHWADHHQDSEVATPEEGLVAEDSQGALLCPKCQKMMTKYRIGVDTSNRIDLCSNCDEAWLDQGEWQLLKQLDVYNCLPSLFTDAWQRNIRKLREKQNLDEHYAKEIGEDVFSKVSEFKVWLDKQPKAGRIKHYLNINFDLK